MPALPSSSADLITLRSISGKSTLLTPPVTLETVLRVATAPPFSFAPESVKIYIHGRIVHLLQYQKQHGADFFQIPLDASAYVPPRATSRVAHSALHASASTSASERKAEARSVIVYGIPQRIRDTASASSAPSQGQALHPPPPTTAALKSILIPTSHRVESQTPLGSPRATAATLSTHHAGMQGASSTHPTFNSTMASLSTIKGPLPYPHSPSGLQELAEICAEIDLNEDDDFLALLQGAPQKVYNHPTIFYMSNIVMGDLAVLEAVMEQVSSVSPLFFNWILKNPHKFLCALNRSGDRPLQQVKEQLRVLALRAMAEQICGEMPSRHVMMLEVNSTDGSPDVYQVEVQVGDFSDASTSSESLMTTGFETRDEVGEEEESDNEEGHICIKEEMEDSDTGSLAFEISNEDGGVIQGADEEEEANEPHRGAIILPSTPGASQGLSSSQPPTDAVPLANLAITRASLPYDGWVPAPEKSAVTQDRGVPAAPPSPVGSVPFGGTRFGCPPLPSTLPAAAKSAPLDESPNVALDAASSPQENYGEDGRLSSLQKELQLVDSLIQVWTDDVTSAAARTAHSAITELRRNIFTALNDVFTASNGAVFSLSRGCRDVRRLSLLACPFFSRAEEFYVQLVEKGVRSTVFGEAPQSSVAAWAAVAALSRLLMCDVDAAAEQKLEKQQQSLPPPRDVGVLCSLQEADPVWACPALRWATAEGPEKLLLALLHLCRQQRAVVLWYSSHHVMKAVGKTIQPMAYIFGGTEESQQAVALQRLKLTTKVHKEDEVADCMLTLSHALTETGTLSDVMRREWSTLMRSRYQRFVMPLEKDLPTPHMTSYPLYVCDTRHVLPPKASGARIGTACGGMGSAARWWAGYCDERHSFCADKWCLAITARPWNVVTAMENAVAEATAESVAVVLTSERTGADAVNSSSVLPLRDCLEHMSWMPVDTVVVPPPAIADALQPRSVARHSAILFEQVSAPSGTRDETAGACRPSGVADGHGMSPFFRGDVHVVDVAAVGAGQMPVLSLAGGEALPTFLATVVRNFVLPASAREPIFLRHLFDAFAKHPSIPVAAAVRDAALANARLQDAPWLVSEHVLFDFGGTLSTFRDARAQVDAAAAARKSVATKLASCTTLAAVPAPIAAPSTEFSKENFVRMPSVPLSQRLTTPRPVPPTQCRSLHPTLRRPLARAPLVTDEVAKRQYVRTHAIDEMYEMMLGSLVEHRPTGEAEVLDHLVQYVEASENVMRGHIFERQAEVSTVGVPKISHGVTPDDPVVSGSSPHRKPQPPSGSRGSFARRKQ
ncbi:hypothetical protein JKF63_00069 [Porcisia hertigi]|uniref:Uncharacterized protein n=1 Tax=Porcisia hertigi TaxID=2761500 RepID=A0A836KWR5_9TRYP|nr:hypothetical protein JKF63_00069 [Porcisia hertigi]